MIASSSGFIRIVSFHPTSFAAGAVTAPSQPTRLMSWMSVMCQCMAWVSTPLWVTFQIWVPSFRLPIGAAARVSLTISVGGNRIPEPDNSVFPYFSMRVGQGNLQIRIPRFHGIKQGGPG